MTSSHLEEIEFAYGLQEYSAFMTVLENDARSTRAGSLWTALDDVLSTFSSLRIVRFGLSTFQSETPSLPCEAWPLIVQQTWPSLVSATPSAVCPPTSPQDSEFGTLRFIVETGILLRIPLGSSLGCCPAMELSTGRCASRSYTNVQRKASLPVHRRSVASVMHNHPQPSSSSVTVDSRALAGKQTNSSPTLSLSLTNLLQSTSASSAPLPCPLFSFSIAQHSWVACLRQGARPL
jgi:hypothetical protein